jgi:xanthine dehydrogenase accessory factor
MRLDVLKAINAARRERRAGALVTRLPGGEERYVAAEDFAADPLAEPLEAALRAGRSGPLNHEGADYFVTVQAPSPRLTMIGAVHISQALAPMARLAGFDCLIIDPRTAFASPERFPDTDVIAQWPDEALAGAPLDRYTAICLLTHDPKIDDPALEIALRAQCFYIGALGSRKTHARRLERMRAKGFDEAALTRVHAPIGLDIGAVSPAEIAVSIIGEIVASLRKKPLRSETATASAA